eukprot:CAMPEP_0181111258 /NCGR_PEP_ID=MMETSP1071-20121207/19174_1 /TAXON_ID=35127 /ORGANISM="Thalassiosira sp., Strain NH16" /LENGTH=596 /DNA_ID=CAMNT_0023195129 /DNA_START=1 /DNA_END=1791 /DNA_ORIENTATION=-
MNLALQDPEISQNAELCTLAVNQINICKDADGILDYSERALFARLNLAAGKHSMSTKKANYQQARGYFEAGISLLHADHWTKQYALSLELYERSIVVGFMDGNVETVPSRVDDILSNARSFDDTVDSRVLLAKYLTSQAQYADASFGILIVLSSFGESFPEEVTESHLTNEIHAITPMLEGITKDTFLNLPTMTDRMKLQAMQFMELLALTSNFNLPSSSMLMNLVSCRMTKLTFSYGFSDQYSIPGLVFMAFGLLHYSNDNIWLAMRLSRIAESLMKENSNVHALRARLIIMIVCVQIFVEPFQSCQAKLVDGYNSAIIAGDVDNAMSIGMYHWGLPILCTADLTKGQNKLCTFLHQLVKRQRIGVLYMFMSYFDVYTAFIGNKDTIGIDPGINMKTNEELSQIAEQSQSSFLMQQVTVNLMFVHCYYREYLECANLAENYQITQTAKRTFDFFLLFYMGLSALNLARDTKEDKWRKIGEDSIKSMARLVGCSTWNFENKHKLLLAELYSLDGRFSMAELSYQSSILSAHDHKFIHEQALACELYGVFLVENKNFQGGMEQLQIALNKYTQWGALKKAMDVMDLMILVSSNSCYG